VIGFLIGLLWGRNLTKLAIIYNTDKWGEHRYTPYYQTHFSSFRLKKISLLEIGVGGYDRPDKGGNSLRMWKRYFPFGKIYSIDIYDKSLQEENRIKIFQGSQIDHNFLDKVMDNIDTPLDIIIDDGSHINEHVINTFEYLFPKLKLGGIYIIEDTQTSYRDEYLGDSNNLNNPNTIMNFFKRIPDCLNHSDFNIKDYTPNYLDKYISSIHFYHNLIFIYKGFNND
jgi:demethylmacrocin O-methyltransferase